MSLSIIDAQRDIILGTIRQITRGHWKVLVVDPDSQKLISNVIDQDQILNENVTNIEVITDRRPTNRDVDAIYLLTPQPHIVDCVMADFDKRKYRKAHLVWTSLLHPTLRDRIDKSSIAREQIALFKVLNVEFYPRESHLVTFRDPWSFPVLFHPACNNLVRQHLEDLAQKIVGVCVALGEYPTIRYYRPRTPTHEASILCSHLARFVQDELDLYAKFHEDFPPQTARPRGALYIVDRSMDLYAPLVHEFTYQAMAHDLLPIKEGDKITYRTIVNEGQPDQEEKDVEISDKDKIWVEHRHRHMKDVIDKITADFRKFTSENANFTKKDSEGVSLNTIKDMMAGLPQFQEQKEAWALNLGMAQEAMNRFQKFKLPDLATVEQILATGLDEEYKKPKGVANQVVAMLDEDGITPPDRLRLLMLYTLFRDGMPPSDLEKLMYHAQLAPQQDGTIIRNLDLVGARVERNIKDSRPIPLPLFPKKPPPGYTMEEYALSRYETVLQNLLEAHAGNTLDANTFPYTKPPLDMNDGMGQQQAVASLRAKPTWAKTRANTSNENRQRVVVFMAGGATYSEARACYTTGRQTNREVFLVTSHMQTPSLFTRQLGDLTTDKRRLNIPMDMPKPQAPRHLFEPDEQPKPRPAPVAAPAPQAQRAPQPPPTAQMNAMNLNGRANGNSVPAKLTKEPEKKEKKKHHFFGKSHKDK
ncbi:Protein transport protein sec1 [Pseudocercospora fuligena]|uniref:Protein transport protein sec1 n=1 Tax=Pseudocercospora fuligena TaxID=685502 RepID=A0A8H6RBP8_9PEZI|nr:Protein transport protein sec1 [Pseudocercospora fuligena]